MMVSLARDQQGNAFELPPEAALWRVRRHTGGRPADMLDSDGDPLFLPITDDRLDLRAKGCSGSMRLEAVDAQRKSLGVQAAFVELGNDEAAQRNSAANNDKDLVRTSFESMTRTMESMQRAQVERERTLAQKEQALTESQVASQKLMVELMIALLDRVGGGKQQDALSVIRQQYEIQKALERQGSGNRNAAPTPPPTPAVEKSDEGGIPPWIKQAVPMIALAGQQFLPDVLSNGDPTKAEGIRQVCSMIGSMFGGPSASASPPIAPAVAPAAQAVAPAADEEVQIVMPRAVRQVFAILDDNEAEKLADHVGELDGAQLEVFYRQATAIVDLDARVAWTRGLLGKSTPDSQATTPEAPTFSLPSIPPQLVPMLAQLSPDEQMLGLQLVGWLDRATLDKLAAELSALTPHAALARVRRMLDEARKRGASVAQRAVASAFTDGKNGAPPNGKNTPNGSPPNGANPPSGGVS
jgi:hypothetical protein